MSKDTLHASRALQISQSLLESEALHAAPIVASEQGIYNKIMAGIETDVVIINGHKTTLPIDLLEYLTSSDIVDLIYKAYRAKYTEAKQSQYEQMLKRPAYPTFNNFDEYELYALSVAQTLAEQEDFDFDVKSHQTQLFSELVAYFGGFHDQLQILSPRKKGIMVVGPMGIGKTFLFKIFRSNPYQSFKLVSAKNIAKAAKADSNSFFESIKKWFEPNIANNFFGQRQLALMIDDLGTEENINDFGNKTNVIQDLIEERYESFKKDKLPNLFITTNLTKDQLTERYGARVVDRLSEMLNIYSFDPTLKSLRQ